MLSVLRSQARCSVLPCMRTYATIPAQTKSTSPILWHYFDKPVPYLDGLRLQETLVARRLASKEALSSLETENATLSQADTARHQAIAQQDILLLLQHTPVYTTGRRETDPAVLKLEKERLVPLGADYIATQRGGQTTYHGPGQLVGYPILDTAEMEMSTRQYVEAISAFLEHLLMDKLGIPLLIPSPQVGAYPTDKSKIASIGIQVRHRITSHGFALNVTDDVKYWFDQIIACGSPDIKATSIESELRRAGRLSGPRPEVADVVPLVVSSLEHIFGRKLVDGKETIAQDLDAILKPSG